jgi:hypothetical protein
MRNVLRLSLFSSRILKHERSSLIIAQQFLYSPLDGEITQVRIVLANSDKENGDIGCVHETDKRADHVADGIALGDDEAVERADGAERGIEVAGLCDGVGADEGLEGNIVSYNWKGAFFLYM